MCDTKTIQPGLMDAIDEKHSMHHPFVDADANNNLSNSTFDNIDLSERAEEDDEEEPIAGTTQQGIRHVRKSSWDGLDLSERLRKELEAEEAEGHVVVGQQKHVRKSSWDGLDLSERLRVELEQEEALSDESEVSGTDHTPQVADVLSEELDNSARHKVEQALQHLSLKVDNLDDSARCKVERTLQHLQQG